LDVKDLDNINETLAKINVWHLNDTNRTEFLLHNLKPEHFDKLIIAIVLDFTKPWDFLDQLAKWADIIFEISKKLPAAKQNEMRKRLEDHFRFYKNPDKKEDMSDTTEDDKNQESNDEEMNEALKNMALDEGILSVNLGIPIIIICNKSEVVASGDTIKYFQTRLEFIMKHIREFALRYGASIIFTSTKKGSNLEELYTYIQHRLFDLSTVSPEITNKESMLIPTGYDSPKLVQQL
jgi:dynein light intermediate chain 1